MRDGSTCPVLLLGILCWRCWGGLRVAWHSFWRDVEHPRLVRVAVLLFPLLALLVLLAHLALPSLAGAAQEPGQRRPGSPTPHPVRSVAVHVQAFYQGDPGIGWDSRAQYILWWPSACSPAALTMALCAWVTPVSIGQVLCAEVQDLISKSGG